MTARSRCRRRKALKIRNLDISIDREFGFSRELHFQFIISHISHFSFGQWKGGFKFEVQLGHSLSLQKSGMFTATSAASNNLTLLRSEIVLRWDHWGQQTTLRCYGASRIKRANLGYRRLPTGPRLTTFCCTSNLNRPVPFIARR